MKTSKKELIKKIVDNSNIIDLTYVKLGILENLFLESLNRDISDEERSRINDLRRDLVKMMIKIQNYESD